ncbi:VWA domain-containing protein [Cetobacterium somerae]|uniref:vWA domain-containing protein n=1 Tax=Cetobacterium sp. NK01 TaxID=2993530 RepID=UPI00211666FE|nr:VWA domain-containing protein [Cetobacterium sp. NK01]MCQ8212815.1 VWA domain-containing protein [Cetobacterium sp. NK01]
MEFGNISSIKFVVIPILTILFLILGVIKREKILKKIGWKKDTLIMIIKTFFISIGAILVFLALLSPQKLKEEEKIEVQGSDLYILMDISKSMLAEDTYPNRLEISKKELKDILNNLKGDRIGIIPFSDSAYVQMPLTDDYFMAINYIDAIDSKLISGGGTELLEALKLANSSFEKTDAKDKNVIIFSDGGEKNPEILKYVKENHIKTFIFGVGTDEGSVIPIDNGFIKDDKGNIVVSKLNDSFLKELAKESGGQYYSLNNLNTSNYKKLIEDIGKLDKTSQRDEKLNVYEHYYQYPLGVGLLLILIGYFLRKKEKEGEYV